MAELPQVAERIVILAAGRLVADTSVAGLRSRHPGDVFVRTSRDERVALCLEGEGASVSQQVGGGLVVRGMEPKAVAELLAYRQVPVYEMRARGLSLEEAYLRATCTVSGGEAPAGGGTSETGGR
jgi:ABC-2 type transport system ATP-binding protein